MGCNWRIRDSSTWSCWTSCGRVVGGEVDLLVVGKGPDRICARSIKYCQTVGELTPVSLSLQSVVWCCSNVHKFQGVDRLRTAS